MYLPKSTTGAFHVSNGMSTHLLAFLDHFKFSPNDFSRSLPNIILYLISAEPYT